MMRSRTMPARRTPPLNRMCVGRRVRWTPAKSRFRAELCRRNSGEMARDRSVGSIRQTDFLQADAPAGLRHVLAGNHGKEAVEQHALEVIAGELAT